MGVLAGQLMMAQGLGYYDETTQEWTCEDECLKRKGGQVCGTTNHFLVANNGGDGSQTTTIEVVFDVTFQTGGGQIMPDGNGGSTTTVTVSELGGVELTISSSISASGDLELSSQAITNEGGLIVSGTYSGVLTADGFEAVAEGDSDAFVLSYGPDGSLQWGAQIGGAGGDVAQAMTTDNLGNTYIGGVFSLTEFNDQITGGPLEDDVQPDAPMAIVVKLDNAGQQLWASAIGQFEGFEFKNMETDDNLDELLIGAEADNLGNENPIFIGGDGSSNNTISAMLNSGGGVNWIGTMQSANPIALNAVHISGDGSFYLGGAFEGPTDFDLGLEEQTKESAMGADLFLAKYSAEGQLIHTHVIDWGNGDDTVESIAEMDDGTLLVVYASAPSMELDLICDLPGVNCTGEQKAGFLSLLPGDIESERIFLPSWSTETTKSTSQEWELTYIGGDSGVLTTSCDHLMVNTPTGPVSIENEPSTVIFEFAIQTKGCTDESACNFDPNASLDDGTCIYDGNCSECGGDAGNCIGCTDPDACNFAPSAYISSECAYPDGCDDPMALNFRSDVLCNDGSCIYPDDLCGDCTVWDQELGTCVEDPACIESCAGDSNNDGLINSADLLSFLTAFGTTCEN